MNLLKGFRGERNIAVTGSRNWLIDYYFKGPPPVAIEFLSKRVKFYEKIVKLLDLKKMIDARSIMVVTKGAIDQDSLNLATNFGIYVVMVGDERGLKAALGGDDLQEVNGMARARLLITRSRKAAKECRSAILEALSKECLTYKELAERLKLRFSQRTVYVQLRLLRSKGIIETVCRREDGKAVFGLPGVSYTLREDLSKTSRVAYVKRLVLSFLISRSRPMSYVEIMRDMRLKRGVVTSALRDLKKRGMVERTAEGWVVRAGFV
ncbi:MAG: winged helix-turn-helix domain-containing protein [Candidatus Methanomethylicaceae archaeon]